MIRGGNANVGVPVLVGRRMLSAKDGLVGRVVSSPEEAREAAAAGANLIVLQVHPGVSFQHLLVFWLYCSNSCPSCLKLCQ